MQNRENSKPDVEAHKSLSASRARAHLVEELKVALPRRQFEQQRLRDKDERPHDLDAQKDERPRIGGRTRLRTKNEGADGNDRIRR